MYVGICSVRSAGPRLDEEEKNLASEGNDVSPKGTPP